MEGKGSEPPIGGANLEINGKIIFQPSEKAAVFLDQFDISSQLGHDYTSISPLVASAITTSHPNPLHSKILLSEHENSLRKLKSTAMGPDLIHNTMLKRLDSNNRSTLLDVLNLIHCTGHVPKSWKEAVVIPLIKTGKKSTKPESYRPISLTSCMCKLYERILHTRLTWYFE